jgi:hypothetical protein
VVNAGLAGNTADLANADLAVVGLELGQAERRRSGIR